MIYINNRIVDTTIFPNKETSIILPERLAQDIADNGAKVTWVWNGNEEIFTLLQVIQCVTSVPSKKQVEVNIPYLPYERSDRPLKGWGQKIVKKFHGMSAIEPHDENYYSKEPMALKVLLRLLPLGPKYTILEPHSVETIKQVKNQVLDVQYKLFNHFNISNHKVYIFPDEGALDRYAHMFNESFEEIIKGMANDNIYLVASKKRDFETGKINHLEVDRQVYLARTPQGLQFKARGFDKGRLTVALSNIFEIYDNRNVILVDDLASFGNTFIKVKQAFQELLADLFENDIKDTKYILSVAHMEHCALEGDLLNEFDSIRTTDSLLNGYSLTSKYFEEKVNISHVLQDAGYNVTINQEGCDSITHHTSKVE